MFAFALTALLSLGVSDNTSAERLFYERNERIKTFEEANTFEEALSELLGVTFKAERFGPWPSVPLALYPSISLAEIYREVKAKGLIEALKPMLSYPPSFLKGIGLRQVSVFAECKSNSKVQFTKDHILGARPHLVMPTKESFWWCLNSNGAIDVFYVYLSSLERQGKLTRESYETRLSDALSLKQPYPLPPFSEEAMRYLKNEPFVPFPDGLNAKSNPHSWVNEALAYFFSHPVSSLAQAIQQPKTIESQAILHVLHTFLSASDLGLGIDWIESFTFLERFNAYPSLPAIESGLVSETNDDFFSQLDTLVEQGKANPQQAPEDVFKLSLLSDLSWKTELIPDQVSQGYIPMPEDKREDYPETEEWQSAMKFVRFYLEHWWNWAFDYDVSAKRYRTLPPADSHARSVLRQRRHARITLMLNIVNISIFNRKDEAAVTKLLLKFVSDLGNWRETLAKANALYSDDDEWAYSVLEMLKSSPRVEKHYAKAKQPLFWPWFSYADWQ